MSSSLNHHSSGKPAAAAPDELNRSVITRYALGSLGTGGYATLPGLVLVYYLTDSLGVGALVAGLIVTGAKIWDVLIDPIIGGLSDRSFTRTGSRRRFMMVGAIGLPLMFILTFSVPVGLSPWISALWVLVAFIGAATFFSLFQVPYIALPAELTSGYQERTRLLTWRVVVLTVAILLFGAGGPEIRGLFPENPPLGYFLMAVVAAVVLGVGLWIAATTAPTHSTLAPINRAIPLNEKRDARTPLLTHYRDGIAVLRDSQPFRALLATFLLQALATGLMLAGAQFVATWVLRDEGAVTILFVALIAPALLFAPVWQRIARKLGKERSFAIASTVFLCATIVLIAMVWAPGWWVLAPVAIAGAAYAGMQTLPMAMLPDVISVDAAERMRTPSDHERSRPSESDVPRSEEGRAGVFSGVWTAGETTGMALGATVLTIVLALTGYIESTSLVTVDQPASAVTGITLSFSLIPAVLMAFSLFTLRAYRLRQRDVEALPHEGENG